MKINVIVTTYNHEKYIAQCLESILEQKGEFQIEVIVGDDCSTDNTRKIVDEYGESHPKVISVLPRGGNLGITKNLKRCLDACSGEYIAICEGDDYWTDEYKLQKQMTLLETHQDFSMCFSAFMIYYEDTNTFEPFQNQLLLKKQILSTKDLILDNSIGNFSCCMYRTKTVKQLPDDLFELFTVDWMFNMVCGQFGEIGFIRDRMSVYRKHSKGAWAGKNPRMAAIELHSYIDEYNKFFGYEFDFEFSLVQESIEKVFPDIFCETTMDLAIIDDVFPHPLSAFRLQEFNSYLKEFNNSKIYSTGSAIHLLGDQILSELFANFKRQFPEYAGRIKKFEFNAIINAKLLYFIFLGNVYINIKRVEELRTPFVFTLYPGGGFGINNSESDMMLRRVTSSPCFQKVIVSQKITYDYLIEKLFCSPEQIELIFGVVTPLEYIESEYDNKVHFGITKTTLDICFVAHKYTERGVDKGYDVFIEVAKVLYTRHSNIRFHVIGGFDENTIDVREIRDRIAFYGNREMKWFDEFYKDKDIILSPNVPFIILEGSFDGFPTGACVDAGLRKTALFCTDELHLNTQFIDGEEIVIIPHNSNQITRNIEYFYRNPEKLKMIAENGCIKIKQIYSYESQILPRIKILKEQIKLADINKSSILSVMSSETKPSFKQRFFRALLSVLMFAKKLTPEWVKRIIKNVFRKIHSNNRLINFVNRFCPDFIVNFYLRIRAQL